MTDRQTVIGFMLTGTLLLLLFFISLFLEGHLREIFIDEGGIVESASTLGYFLCAVLMVYKGRRAYLKQYPDIFLLIVTFMLKEMDFDSQFTSMGIFKIKFFISNTVPTEEKLFGMMGILLLICMFFSILYRHSRDFYQGLKHHSIISIGTLSATILLMISISLDGIDRKLQGFVQIGEKASMHASSVEEILELGIPIIILLTINSYFKKNEI